LYLHYKQFVKRTRPRAAGDHEAEKPQSFGYFRNRLFKRRDGTHRLHVCGVWVAILRLENFTKSVNCFE